MNYTLFKSNIKQNRTIWIIIVLVLTMYISIMMSMYDPENAEAIEEMMKMFPEEMLSMMGFIIIGPGLANFIASYIYGFLIFMFPLIYTSIVNNRLIAKHVDSGAMAYILSTPNSRKKIATTQALFSILSISLLIIVVTIISIIMSFLIHPGELNVGKFILLNIYTIVFYIAISGISFFASAIFNETSRSLAIGTGIPIGFFVIQLLGNASSGTSWAKNFTLFSLYSPDKLMSGQVLFVMISSIILLIIGIGLYIGAIYQFNKRDLPL